MLIDCDVHVYPANPQEIKDYLQQPWKHRFEIRKQMYYKTPSSPDGRPAPDPAAASKPEALREHIRKNRLSHAILIALPHASANHDPDFAAAVASAYNDWLAEVWLGRHNADGVFKGTICISHQDPKQAAAEIDRWAEHPHFV
ncbi:Amidohydrolase [Paenibacillus sp. UNC496MF]|nr:Amidohydrolase [Paenibacillus sp. UNC496MF]